MRISQITVLFSCLFITSCKLSLPTDNEMIQHFTLHEAAFNKIQNVISQRTYGCYYPPYRTDTLYGEDQLSIKKLSQEDKQLLDSLLLEINCERIFYWNKERKKETGHDSTEIIISIPYFMYGLSIGGTTKEFLYAPNLKQECQSIENSQMDLNELYRSTDSDTTFYKLIKNNWYIKLEHDN